VIQLRIFLKIIVRIKIFDENFKPYCPLPQKADFYATSGFITDPVFSSRLEPHKYITQFHMLFLLLASFCRLLTGVSQAVCPLQIFCRKLVFIQKKNIL
jgi:hypothetical protein